ncbi:MAG: putative manganese-dependent inorganic diphosphatase [Methanomicrobiales archaeon]|nr:putative manganese-dependent inorganic diphosphatase [Methanomicrobiales archaeon]
MSPEEEQNNPVRPHHTYVIGHRNPDTDSIGSVIGYTELLNRKEPGRYIAARCGEVNEETAFALSLFGVEVPRYIESVEPSVADLPYLDTRSVGKDLPTIDIAELMDTSDMRNMPVTDEYGSLLGLVSEYGLARAYVRRHRIEQLSLAPIPLQTLAWILSANVVVASRDRLEGKVYIAIDALHVTLSRLTANDVAIIGDNEPAQLALISGGLAALIIADGAPVGERVISAARQKGVSILITALDAFGVGKMINLSLPGRMIMEGEVPTIQLRDSLEYAKHVISNSKFRTACVVDGKGRFLGQISRSSLMQDVHKSVILLDHNEAPQAVEGIERADILEIIDHHRLGAITTLKPVKFLNDPVGSTSTIIAHKFIETGVPPSLPTAGILLAGILSDTLALRMSTTTQADHQAAEYLSGICGKDPVRFGAELIQRGMRLANIPLAEILTRDIKRYNLFGREVIISQVMVHSYDFPTSRKEEISTELFRLRESHGVDMYVALFTNVLEEGSEVFVAADETTISKMGYRDQPQRMEGLMSRKKDFLPRFGQMLRVIS